jgi:DNA-binding beta-propeller fold protein YncE
VIPTAPADPERDYLVWVVSESSDTISLVRVGPSGTRVEREIETGLMPSCSPTWAQPSADGERVFVACNKSDEIVEIDIPSWKLVRRIPAGPGVYNLGVSGDGKLVASNKRGQSVSVFDVALGKELARIPTRAKLVHGVAVSFDSRFAFVSEEAIGKTPGIVEVIDLTELESAGNVEVGLQAAGLDFWKIEAARAQ